MVENREETKREIRPFYGGRTTTANKWAKKSERARLLSVAFLPFSLPS